MNKHDIVTMVLILFAVTVAGFSFSKPVHSQNHDERAIVPEKFVEKRLLKSRRTFPRHLNYKRVTQTEIQQGAGSTARYAQLGVTIWRLRRSGRTDNGPKITDSGTQWIPIRVEAGQPLTLDDLVRLSIESSIEGYLYVIDRGAYLDSKTSEPTLIFPTTRTRGGDNNVRPGRLIEIPGQSDSPNYFRLTSKRGELIDELLTIIVSKEPIGGIAEQLSSRPIVLDDALFAKWQTAWTRPTEHFELTDGAGKPWTKAEQEAGTDGSRELTQDDAPPQTIFRVRHGANDPIMVNLDLRVRRSL